MSQGEPHPPRFTDAFLETAGKNQEWWANHTTTLVQSTVFSSNTVGPLPSPLRPLWDTTPLPTPPPTLADYQEACRKIRDLAASHVGPWSTWKTILDLLPKEQ